MRRVEGDGGGVSARWAGRLGPSSHPPACLPLLRCLALVSLLLFVPLPYQAVYDQLYANALELQSKRQQTLQEERKQAEAEASAAHATTTSQRLFERLKAKRFSQIFAYLDADRAGAIDLVAMVRTPSPRVEELDSEVREDVELAAELHAHQHGAGVGEGKEGSDGGPEGAGAPAVGAEQFEALMEAALKLRRGPRSYLVPSPSAKAQVQPSFRPAINQRSREMAARLRPPEADTYELLHGTADAVRQKLEASRKAAEDEALRECTFVPLLNANRCVRGEGGPRLAGTGWVPAEGEFDK